MIWRAVALSALFAIAVPAQGDEPVKVAPALNSDDAQQNELIGYAVTLISQGKPQQAIDRYLDNIIAHYETRYADKKPIYAARSLTETLMYAVMAATALKQDKAAASTGKTVVLGPQWAEALFDKGFALVDLGKRDEAKGYFERAIVLSPQNSRYIAELGNVYQQGKDWPKALETFGRAEAAAAFSPDELKTAELTRALRGQGFALTELGRYDESTKLYRRCLTLDPKDQIAAQELGYVAGLRAKAKPLPST